MGRILDDPAYREIYWEVARQTKDVDLRLLQLITELEESKMDLGRRRGIFQDLLRIINNYLDEKGE
jgi:hypothetical protein